MKNNLPKRQALWRLIPTLLAFMLFAVSGRGQTYLQESFDDATFPPTGWTQTQLNLTGLWAQVTSGTSPTCANHSGAGMLKYNCYSYSNGTAAVIITPNIDLSASSNVSVEFWMYRDAAYATNVDNVEVLINTTANVTGATSLGVINRPKASTPIETGADGWYKYSFTIPASFNTATNYLFFKATAKYGNNIFVDDIKVFTPTIPDGVPTTFSTTAVSKTGMTINWVDNSTNETGFTVYISPDNVTFSKFGADVVSTSSATTGSSYLVNVTGLTYGHTYYFKIVAYSGGETAPLTGNQATLAGDPADAAPTALTFSSVGLTSMTVGWTDNSTNETAFRVYRATAFAGPYTKIGSDIASTTTAGVGTAYSLPTTGLASSTSYYYRVVAVLEGESSYLTGNQATNSPVAADAAPTSITFTGVGISYMTVGWTDNSTNETAFRVYRATDIAGPYTQVGTDISTTTSAGIGTAYNALSTGLTQSTTYFYKVVAVCDLESAALTGSQATTAPVPMGGTYTIGFAPANYQSLGAAFADITGNGLAAPINLVLQADYDAYEELAIPIVPSKNATATNTITIYPATSGIAIDYSSGTGLINFDGVNFVTIDGRVGGVGSTVDLILKNGSMGNYVVQLVNDASNNTIKYCTVKGGSNTNTIGLITFGGTTGLTGNDNNLIDHCDIKPAVLYYTTGIYSNGNSTLGKENSGNTISNCTISNFCNLSSTSGDNGVYLAGGNTDWTIAGNSFYQTSARNYTAAATHIAINIASFSGNNFFVTNNFIGGNSANVGGSPWTISYSAAIANRFVGIKMAVGSTVASSLQGNTIANMALSSSSAAATAGGAWCGIYITSGKVNVGDNTSNTIGSGSGNGSVISTITTSGGLSSGIYIEGSTTANITNNVIGSIATAGSTASISHSFTGIVTTGGNLTISGNTIGSLSTLNSINASTAATGSTAQIVTGINNSGSGIVSIMNNTIANLNNAYTPSTASSKNIVSGIVSSNGTTTISGNTVRNLTTVANATGTSATASVIGVAMTSTTTPALVSQNSIYNLSNNHAGANAVLVTGIFYNGPASGMVERNLIYGLNTTSTSESATISGIQINGGTTTFQNNMISLGQGLATGYAINGIYENLGTNNLYFNSINIGGTTTTSNQRTFAFYGNQTYTTRLFKNNIFVNARNTSAGSGKNYAVKVGGSGVNPSGLTIDYNIYQVSGSAGVLGFFNNADVADLTAWQTVVGQDAHSLNVDPKFVNPTASTPDLHLQGGTPADMAGIDIPAITNDFFGDVRASLTPTDIGADAGNFDNVVPTTTVTPINGTTDINVGDNIVFTFSKNVRKTDNSAIDASVITYVNVTDANAVVPFTAAYDAASKTLTVKLSPDGTAMLGFKNYKVSIAGVEDFNDNALVDTYTSFTTGTADAVAPAFTSAVVENGAPKNIQLTFSENIKMDNATGFTVIVAGSPAIVSSYALLNSVLTLTLSEAVTTHQSVTVEYAGGNIKDISDNVLADFTAQMVTNNTKSSAKDFLTFSFLKANNGTLAEDVVGVVGGNAVDLYVHMATSLTALKATYTTSEHVQMVEIGALLQVSDVTINNFTAAVTYKITAEDNSTVNFTVMFHFIHAVPYAQTFDAITFPPTDWMVVNVGTGSTWNRSGSGQAGAGSMYYYANASNAANAWAYTPGLNLEIGKKYVVEFWEKAATISSSEKLKLTVGQQPNVAAQTTELWKDENLTNSTWAKIKSIYTAPVSGNYHFGFNCYSAANQYNLYVDEVSVREINHIALISAIQVDGAALTGFTGTTFTYSKVLPFGTTAVPLISEVTLADVNAAKVITQAVNLTGTEADRTATVLVTAEDGTTTNKYSVVYSVAKNFDASLTDLMVNGSTVLGFNSTLHTYSVVLPYGATVVPQISGSTLSDINAAKVTTQATNLNGTLSERTATVAVTAEDGVATTTYSVVFSIGEPTTHAVNFSVVGAQGTIIAIVDASYIANGELVVEGKDVAFTATPADGYRVKEWNNGSVVAGNTTTNYTLTALAAAATITVEFEQIPATTYAVNFSVVGANGTIAATVDGSAIATGALIVAGKGVVFTAIPATNYKVKEWVNGNVVDGNVTNAYTVNGLSSAVTVTVEFMSTTGIEGNEEVNTLVYPNPFQSELNLKNASEISRVDILNIGGMLIKSIDCKNSNELCISTNDLKAGVYFIRMVDTMGKEITKKMIKE
ncbi:fibronectin type III domain-containing protein [Williamwhitmania taraxaci]|uniref:Repeat-containing protein n=1 Tax=Williamwhitmania taraxaci TaxID=1640674 RepID=A0A1G6PA48_9BACT|nr:T9SS type A sorting domain-containing protein [Williamwhitmania taraxaci]SDC77150.1 repeat-containing protein [Williamwhitmania taraxaci]